MADKFKVRVWAIIGEKGTGKSLTIGHLVSQTGLGPLGFRKTLLRGGGYLYLYARKQSLQEGKHSPQDFVDDVRKVARKIVRRGPHPSWINVLVSMRFDSLGRGRPSGDTYLSCFVDQGWSIEALALLDQDSWVETREAERRMRYHEFGAPTIEIPRASDMADEPDQQAWLVSTIRNHFGWA
jgi:hypothetical protein